MKKSKYSSFEIDEIKKCMADPIYFMTTYVKIQHPVKGQINFNATEEQCEYIDACDDYRFVIASFERQKGKTTAGAAYLLWKVLFHPDLTILACGAKHEHAREILWRIRYSYECLPEFLQPSTTTWNKGCIEFENGSRIIGNGITANTAKGLTVSLLYIDEFAFVEPKSAKEFWSSIAPTLSTGADCIISSTGNGENDNMFKNIWMDSITNEVNGIGINGFKSVGKYTVLNRRW